MSWAQLIIAVACGYSGLAFACAAMAQQNIAPLGTPIFGAGADLLGTTDVTVDHVGPMSEINDGVFNLNLSPNGYTITGNGQTGANGNGVDSFAGGVTTNPFDFVGVLFSELQYGVTSVRVQNFVVNDGGWWGPTNVTLSNAPLASSDIAAPVVQTTSDGGATWSTVSATSDYAAQYTGVVRSTGAPLATSGPFATFSFAAQDGIDGIRLIGDGSGPADGNGFIGVNEFEAYGVTQQLHLEVNAATGQARLVNNVQSAIEFDFYRITSASGSLDLSVGGWDSFQNPVGNPPGFPAGSGAGDGWESLGNLSDQLVAEAFLQGSSELAPGESAYLGRLFASGTQDLELRYRTPSGQLINVPATFVSGDAADFNFDGSVDGLDLAAWQQSVGPSRGADGDGDGDSDGADFLAWQRQLTETSPSSAAVPEASSAMLALLGSAIFQVGRLRGFSRRGQMNVLKRLTSPDLTYTHLGLENSL